VRSVVVPAAAALVAVVVASQSSWAETIQIEVKQLAYTPSQVTAHVGDTIEWVNKDFIVHTATGRNHEWDVTIPAHGSGQAVMMKPGTVEYYCRFHPNMKGGITVDGP
jgi:plastocyanin